MRYFVSLFSEVRGEVSICTVQNINKWNNRFKELFPVLCPIEIVSAAVNSTMSTVLWWISNNCFRNLTWSVVMQSTKYQRMKRLFRHHQFEFRLDCFCSAYLNCHLRYFESLFSEVRMCHTQMELSYSHHQQYNNVIYTKL